VICPTCAAENRDDHGSVEGEFTAAIERFRALGYPYWPARADRRRAERYPDTAGDPTRQGADIEA
jgi:hypothetical protein